MSRAATLRRRGRGRVGPSVAEVDAAPFDAPLDSSDLDGANRASAATHDAATAATAVASRLRRRVGLRNRITLLFPVLTLVLTSAVALGVYQVVRTSQLSARESEARSSAFFNASILQERLANKYKDAGRIIDALPRSLGGESGLFFEGGASGGASSDWYSTNAATLGASDLPVALRDAVRQRREPVVQRFSLPELGPVLVVGVPIESLPAAYFELTPLEDLEQTLDNLAVALPGAVALTTMVAVLLGHWVARAALAPLTDISRAAEAIAADKLDTRLPATNDPQLTPIVSSFNNMASALQDRVERDARFASDVSHELRSPLMTLSASIEVLERRRDEMPERAVKALDLLAADIDRFQSLVADLLEISRFDSGTQELEVSPVGVAGFLEGLAQAVAGRRVPVVLPPDADDLVVLVDRRRIIQVLTNLINNAEKYAGGVTRVTLDRVGGGVEIGVEDDGPGVPEVDREHIFERFARGTSAGRRDADSGTGLGLSLVAAHVRLHGGRVWCTTARKGTGARFTVFLPTALKSMDDELIDYDIEVGAEA
jgi:two-component system, OmpR family, sensor histidine kinase MtrB